MLIASQAGPKAPSSNEESHRRQFALAAAVVVVAAVARLAGLDRVPPGLQHDEVFGAVFAESVFAGSRPIFLDANGGNEPLFLYAVTAAMAAFGRNVLALRLPSAAAGLVGLCATYRLARQLLDPRHAIVAAMLMSVSLWHVLDSRVSLRAIWLPAVSTIAAVCLWRWLERGSWRWWALGTGCLGLSLYTYTSAALVPASVALFGVVLACRRSERRAGFGLLLAAAVAVAMGLPLFVHMASVPSASVRVRDLSYELTQLRAGNPGPVLANAGKVLGMFAFTGDPEWRYNVAGRPVFSIAIGLAFYAGAVVAARRCRRREYAFLLVWQVTNLGAAIATGSAPSSLRAVGAMPTTFCLAAIGCWWCVDRLQQSRRVAPLALPLLAAALLWEAGDSLYAYFATWAGSSEVREVYRADLATAARYLSHADVASEVLVSSQYAADLDRQSFEYLGFADVEPRWFDAAQALLLPSGGATVVMPSLRLPAEALRPVLSGRGRMLDSPDGLEVWSLAPAGAEQGSWLADVVTGWSTQAARIEAVSLPGHADAGTAVETLVRWRVSAQAPGGRDLTFFAHLRDAEGRLWSQVDVLAYPTSDWRVGDEVYQLLRVPVPSDMPSGRATIEVGLYEEATLPLTLILQPGNVSFSRLQAGEVTIDEGVPAQTADVDPEVALDVAIGTGARLIGASVEPRILQPGGSTDVSLWWQVEQCDATGVSFSLRNASAQVRLGNAAALAAPGNDGMRVLRQRTTLAVPRDIERGEWRLVATLADGTDSYLGEVFAAGIERDFGIPSPAVRLDASYAGGARLVGADLQTDAFQDAGEASATLYWACDRVMDESYTVFFHLVAEDGTVLAAGDSIPAGGARPTTGWLRGETIADTHALSLGGGAAAGRYRIVAGLYRAGEPGYPRLALVGGGDAVTIAEIEVGE